MPYGQWSGPVYPVKARDPAPATEASGAADLLAKGSLHAGDSLKARARQVWGDSVSRRGTPAPEPAISSRPSSRQARNGRSASQRDSEGSRHELDAELAKQAKTMRTWGLGGKPEHGARRGYLLPMLSSEPEAEELSRPQSSEDDPDARIPLSTYDAAMEIAKVEVSTAMAKDIVERFQVSYNSNVETSCQESTSRSLEEGEGELSLVSKAEDDDFDDFDPTTQKSLFYKETVEAYAVYGTMEKYVNQMETLLNDLRLDLQDDEEQLTATERLLRADGFKREQEGQAQAPQKTIAQGKFEQCMEQIAVLLRELGKESERIDYVAWLKAMEDDEDLINDLLDEFNDEQHELRKLTHVALYEADEYLDSRLLLVALNWTRWFSKLRKQADHGDKLLAAQLAVEVRKLGAAEQLRVAAQTKAAAAEEDSGLFDSRDHVGGDEEPLAEMSAERSESLRQLSSQEQASFEISASAELPLEAEASQEIDAEFQPLDDEHRAEKAFKDFTTTLKHNVQERKEMNKHMNDTREKARRRLQDTQTVKNHASREVREMRNKEVTAKNQELRRVGPGATDYEARMHRQKRKLAQRAKAKKGLVRKAKTLMLVEGEAGETHEVEEAPRGRVHVLKLLGDDENLLALKKGAGQRVHMQDQIIDIVKRAKVHLDEIINSRLEIGQKQNRASDRITKDMFKEQRDQRRELRRSSLPFGLSGPDVDRPMPGRSLAIHKHGYHMSPDSQDPEVRGLLVEQMTFCKKLNSDTVPVELSDIWTGVEGKYLVQKASAHKKTNRLKNALGKTLGAKKALRALGGPSKTKELDQDDVGGGPDEEDLVKFPAFFKLRDVQLLLADTITRRVKTLENINDQIFEVVVDTERRFGKGCCTYDVDSNTGKFTISPWSLILPVLDQTLKNLHLKNRFGLGRDEQHLVKEFKNRANELKKAIAELKELTVQVKMKKSEASSKVEHDVTELISDVSELYRGLLIRQKRSDAYRSQKMMPEYDKLHPALRRNLGFASMSANAETAAAHEFPEDPYGGRSGRDMWKVTRNAMLAVQAVGGLSGKNEEQPLPDATDEAFPNPESKLLTFEEHVQLQRQHGLLKTNSEKVAKELQKEVAISEKLQKEWQTSKDHVDTFRRLQERQKGVTNAKEILGTLHFRMQAMQKNAQKILGPDSDYQFAAAERVAQELGPDLDMAGLNEDGGLQAKLQSLMASIQEIPGGARQSAFVPAFAPGGFRASMFQQAAPGADGSRQSMLRAAPGGDGTRPSMFQAGQQLRRSPTGGVAFAESSEGDHGSAAMEGSTKLSSRLLMKRMSVAFTPDMARKLEMAQEKRHPDKDIKKMTDESREVLEKVQKVAISKRKDMKKVLDLMMKMAGTPNSKAFETMKEKMARWEAEMKLSRNVMASLRDAEGFWGQRYTQWFQQISSEYNEGIAEALSTSAEYESKEAWLEALEKELYEHFRKLEEARLEQEEEKAKQQEEVVQKRPERKGLAAQLHMQKQLRPKMGELLSNLRQAKQGGEGGRNPDVQPDQGPKSGLIFDLPDAHVDRQSSQTVVAGGLGMTAALLKERLKTKNRSGGEDVFLLLDSSSKGQSLDGSSDQPGGDSRGSVFKLAPAESSRLPMRGRPAAARRASYSLDALLLDSEESVDEVEVVHEGEDEDEDEEEVNKQIEKIIEIAEACGITGDALEELTAELKADLKDDPGGGKAQRAIQYAREAYTAAAFMGRRADDKPTDSQSGELESVPAMFRRRRASTPSEDRGDGGSSSSSPSSATRRAHRPSFVFGGEGHGPDSPSHDIREDPAQENSFLKRMFMDHLRENTQAYGEATDILSKLKSSRKKRTAEMMEALEAELPQHESADRPRRRLTTMVTDWSEPQEESRLSSRHKLSQKRTPKKRILKPADKEDDPLLSMLIGGGAGKRAKRERKGTDMSATSSGGKSSKSVVNWSDEEDDPAWSFLSDRALGLALLRKFRQRLLKRFSGAAEAYLKSVSGLPQHGLSLEAFDSLAKQMRFREDFRRALWRLWGDLLGTQDLQRVDLEGFTEIFRLARPLRNFRDLRWRLERRYRSIAAAFQSATGGRQALSLNAFCKMLEPVGGSAVEAEKLFAAFRHHGDGSPEVSQHLFHLVLRNAEGLIAARCVMRSLQLQRGGLEIQENNWFTLMLLGHKDATMDEAGEKPEAFSKEKLRAMVGPLGLSKAGCEALFRLAASSTVFQTEKRQTVRMEDVALVIVAGLGHGARNLATALGSEFQSQSPSDEPSPEDKDAAEKWRYKKCHYVPLAQAYGYGEVGLAKRLRQSLKDTAEAGVLRTGTGGIAGDPTEVMAALKMLADLEKEKSESASRSRIRQLRRRSSPIQPGFSSGVSDSVSKEASHDEGADLSEEESKAAPDAQGGNQAAEGTKVEEAELAAAETESAATEETVQEQPTPAEEQPAPAALGEPTPPRHLSKRPSRSPAELQAAEEIRRRDPQNIEALRLLTGLEAQRHLRRQGLFDGSQDRVQGAVCSLQAFRKVLFSKLKSPRKAFEKMSENKKELPLSRVEDKVKKVLGMNASDAFQVVMLIETLDEVKHLDFAKTIRCLRFAAPVNNLWEFRSRLVQWYSSVDVGLEIIQVSKKELDVGDVQGLLAAAGIVAVDARKIFRAVDMLQPGGQRSFIDGASIRTVLSFAHTLAWLEVFVGRVATRYSDAASAVELAGQHLPEGSSTLADASALKLLLQPLGFPAEFIEETFKFLQSHCKGEVTVSKIVTLIQQVASSSGKQTGQLRRSTGTASNDHQKPNVTTAMQVPEEDMESALIAAQQLRETVRKKFSGLAEVFGTLKSAARESRPSQSEAEGALDLTQSWPISSKASSSAASDRDSFSLDKGMGFGAASNVDITLEQWMAAMDAFEFEDASQWRLLFGHVVEWRHHHWDPRNRNVDIRVSMGMLSNALEAAEPCRTLLAVRNRLQARVGNMQKAWHGIAGSAAYLRGSSSEASEPFSGLVKQASDKKESKDTKEPDEAHFSAWCSALKQLSVPLMDAGHVWIQMVSLLRSLGSGPAGEVSISKNMWLTAMKLAEVGTRLFELVSRLSIQKERVRHVSEAFESDCYDRNPLPLERFQEELARLFEMPASDAKLFFAFLDTRQDASVTIDDLMDVLTTLQASYLPFQPLGPDLQPKERREKATESAAEKRAEAKEENSEREQDSRPFARRTLSGVSSGPGAESIFQRRTSPTPTMPEASDSSRQGLESRASVRSRAESRASTSASMRPPSSLVAAITSGANTDNQADSRAASICGGRTTGLTAASTTAPGDSDSEDSGEADVPRPWSSMSASASRTVARQIAVGHHVRKMLKSRQGQQKGQLSQDAEAVRSLLPSPSPRVHVDLALSGQGRPSLSGPGWQPDLQKGNASSARPAQAKAQAQGGASKLPLLSKGHGRGGK
eukprot:TRINITY_DN40045_c0_g1_i1.p1 TRINITY_DN40045_c0_g1~~TRINITY_DN40045_c0_g1_i1.p1  ORF type:complete len:3406 (+),score=825.34 TRINITY_DN40045_c0_g1_i1:101-10318(+)